MTEVKYSNALEELESVLREKGRDFSDVLEIDLVCDRPSHKFLSDCLKLKIDWNDTDLQHFKTMLEGIDYEAGNFKIEHIVGCIFLKDGSELCKPVKVYNPLTGGVEWTKFTWVCVDKSLMPAEEIKPDRELNLAKRIEDIPLDRLISEMERDRRIKSDTESKGECKLAVLRDCDYSDPEIEQAINRLNRKKIGKQLSGKSAAIRPAQVLIPNVIKYAAAPFLLAVCFCGGLGFAVGGLTTSLYWVFTFSMAYALLVVLGERRS